ncbi:MAG: NAD(P)H-hydrate dehydratase [Marinicaulis sp.]|nr:NAD(P)H-hydrate dehydratase [Marinicaulis sp.]
MNERRRGEVSSVSGFIVLSTSQMQAAEKAAIAAGVGSAGLMETAGGKVAETIMLAWTKRPVVVICGPGNNGGDGFVVARRLADAEWPVKVAEIGDPQKLTGDAKLMADLYQGERAAFANDSLEGAGLIVDAIFGTGISRDVDGAAKQAIDAINAHSAAVVAVDLPSGIHSDTGFVMGAAVSATRTITFFQRKPGHLLFPGRAFCGQIDVADIGIEADHVRDLTPDIFENHPALWGSQFRRPDWRAHKYHRGHVFAVSGERAQSGAIRLAATGALRVGAGLVTVLSPKDAIDAHSAQLNAIMLRAIDGADHISEQLGAKENYQRICLLGPGNGVGEATRENVLAALRSNAGAVLDADALTSFADDRDTLFQALRGNDVLTPHAGEFAGVFPIIDLGEGRLAAARTASRRCGAVVVFKGADTVIASPDGRCAINTNAPGDLATAGAGDVLAGFIAGFLAQGMSGFDAACAGVWFHGACAQTIGPGLIAEDLPNAVPAVLRTLLSPPTQRDTQQQNQAQNPAAASPGL